ncbi:MAG: hypothetical protein M3384_06010 [Acidobacteriota bacterium]|nr:hypothetical protein [Acidobacteriota bacterium]
MSNDKLQKKAPDSLKEKSQYALAFGVIAMMLFAVGFPVFVIAFFGIFAFFLWKTFATASPNGVREVFEFYLSANEVLRDDERRWFGFEVQEVIGRGERILQTMNGAPPLVYFTLGALYNKVGDHKSAVNHLAYVVENENSDESTYNYPSPELRNYTKILRKIEREPADAPQTSAAVRALERARRNRGKALLEQSRDALKEIEKKRSESVAEQKRLKAEAAAAADAAGASAFTSSATATYNGKDAFMSTVSEAGIESFAESREKSAPTAPRAPAQSVTSSAEEAPKENGNGQKEQNPNDHLYNQRKPISEVLNDLYGEK